MDLIEQIGAILGLVAFVGLAVLVLLYFQQARDVRRLREWAGRAPERAAEAADEAAAAAAREAGIEPQEQGASEAPLRERVLARLRLARRGSSPRSRARPRRRCASGCWRGCGGRRELPGGFPRCRISPRPPPRWR